MPLQVPIHLVERKLREASKFTTPGLNNALRNEFDQIRIGAIEGDGGDVACVTGFADAVVEHSRRQILGGCLQRDRIIRYFSGIAQLAQAIDERLD